MYKILVCDDDRDIVSALEIYLKAEGYQVEKAYNGQEALACVEKEEIHLVLMDIMMPGLDGISATIQLRRASNVPVILITAKSEDTDKVLGLNLGDNAQAAEPGGGRLHYQALQSGGGDGPGTQPAQAVRPAGRHGAKAHGPANRWHSPGRRGQSRDPGRGPGSPDPHRI